MSLNRFAASTGFTLLEMLVSITLVSLVAAYFIQYQLESLSQRIAESLAQDILSLSNTSLAFFGQSLQWPDQDNDCSNVLGVLQNAEAFPLGYEPAYDVVFEFDCADNDMMGRILSIYATFPSGEKDQADLLMSYLPTASLTYDEDAEVATVQHFTAQPRKASQRYQFFKGLLNSGQVSIPKPDCWGEQNKQYFLMPQSVCIAQPNGQYGIGGYYFRQISEDESSWQVVLRVANGDDNNSPGDYYNAPDQCGGESIWIGAVTYCE